MNVRYPGTLLILLVLGSGGAGAAPSAESVRNGIRELVADAKEADRAIGPDRVHAVPAVARFYGERDHRPAWNAALRDELLGEIRAASRDGLDPSGYHLALLERRIRRVDEPDPEGRRAAELDVLLSDAFLLLSSHLLAGKTNPVTIDAEWFVDRREGDMVRVLEEALAGKGVTRSLESLRPVEPEYTRLRSHLARLRAIAAAGGWPLVEGGGTLRPGETDPRIVQVRRRLDHPDPADDTDPALYDPDLEVTVRAFQARHGLRADGAIGSRTLAALNVPVEDRIDFLLANLERWRWLPRDLGARHIRVNIAGYGMEVMEDDRPVLAMKVVVGRRARRTPVFTGSLSYLVFSPVWDVPRKLAVQDKLPLIRKDPAYLDTEGYVVFAGEGSTTLVDPASVDWEALGPRNFPYRLRQQPGPKNALGGVKFMFPNRFSVYLHDTPSRELFAEDERAFSSGCIRLERPADLAEYLLRGRSGWSPEAIAKAMASGKETRVNLETPLPVHLLYWTAWQGEEELQFRPDLYDRDRPLLEALREAPPEPE